MFSILRFLGKITLSWRLACRWYMVGLFRINIPGDYRGRIRKREKLGCYIVTVKPQPPKPQGARGLGFSSSYWPVLQKGCLWVG